MVVGCQERTTGFHRDAVERGKSLDERDRRPFRPVERGDHRCHAPGVQFADGSMEPGRGIVQPRLGGDAAGRSRDQELLGERARLDGLTEPDVHPHVAVEVSGDRHGRG
jgi:hypothetical protein